MRPAHAESEEINVWHGKTCRHTRSLRGYRHDEAGLSSQEDGHRPGRANAETDRAGRVFLPASTIREDLRDHAHYKQEHADHDSQLGPCHEPRLLHQEGADEEGADALRDVASCDQDGAVPTDDLPVGGKGRLYGDPIRVCTSQLSIGSRAGRSTNRDIER